MKRKPVIVLLLIVLITVGIFQFIKMNNDHVECDTAVLHSKNDLGAVVITRQHICKEVLPL